MYILVLEIFEQKQTQKNTILYWKDFWHQTLHVPKKNVLRK